VIVVLNVLLSWLLLSGDHDSKHSGKRKSVTSEEGQGDGVATPHEDDSDEDQVLSVQTIEANHCDHIPDSLKLG